MVSRKTKVTAASLVMAAGIGLAWPFRRSEPPAPVEPVAAAAAVPPQAVAPVRIAPTFSLPSSVAASFAADSTALTSTTERPAANIADPAFSAPITPSDADLPAEPPAVAVPVGPPTELVAEPAGPPAERIHVVHDGDSLERLAKRYLDDESRALEIFDLNRGTLENPHWLTIGAELRIPPRTASD